MPVTNCGADPAGLHWIVMIITVYSATAFARIFCSVHYFASEYKIEKSSSIQSLITELRYLVLLAFDNTLYFKRVFKH